MHPNRQFRAHFVVHMHFCLHDLLRVAHPLHSNRGGKRTITWGMFPPGSEDTVTSRRLLCNGGGGTLNFRCMMFIPCDWIRDEVDELKLLDTSPICCPDHQAFANMMAAVCAKIFDNAVRAAFKKAYFPAGRKIITVSGC